MALYKSLPFPFQFQNLDFLFLFLCFSVMTTTGTRPATCVPQLHEGEAACVDDKGQRVFHIGDRVSKRQDLEPGHLLGKVRTFLVKTNNFLEYH